jgi:hypothetical protein
VEAEIFDFIGLRKLNNIDFNPWQVSRRVVKVTWVDLENIE